MTDGNSDTQKRIAETKRTYDWLDYNKYSGDSDVKMVWVDVETTGLDPRTNELLEFAVVLTDERGKVIDSMETIIVPSASPDIDRLRDAVPGVVRDMHDRSHLWDDLRNSDPASWNHDEATRELYHFFNKHLYRKPKFPLAGSTVSFDRSFLSLYFPELIAQFFGHRHIDVSSLIEIARITDPNFETWHAGLKDKQWNVHRALPDICDSIKAYQSFLLEYTFLPDKMWHEIS